MKSVQNKVDEFNYWMNSAKGLNEISKQIGKFSDWMKNP